MILKVVEDLGRVSERWLRDSSLRRRGAEALTVSTGFAPRKILRAIDAAFGELTEAKLRRFASRFIENAAEPLPVAPRAAVVHIAAGNVFTSWLHGVVITLLMDLDVRVKPSSREPVFAPLWRESVREICPSLAERLRLIEWDEVEMARAGAVVAYGSDESLERIKAHLGPSTIWVGYGHKMSAAVVFRDSIRPGAWALWRARARADLEMFGLDGCLSPQLFIVEESAGAVWDEFLKTRGVQPRMEKFSHLSEVIRKLQPLANRLSAVGIAGSPRALESLRAPLERLGVTRICALGSMQRPPLEWRNGNISLVEALAPLWVNQIRANAR